MLLAVPLPVHAGDGRGLGIAVFAGPIAPLEDSRNTEAAVGGRLSVQVEPKLTFGVDVTYVDPDTERLSIPLTVDNSLLIEASGDIWEVLPYLQLKPAAVWLPYMRMHVGASRVAYETVMRLDNLVFQRESDTETKVVVGGGLGYQLRVGAFLESFVEGNIHLAEDTEYYSVRFGIGVRGRAKPK